MSKLVAIHGPDEADDARVGALLEFLEELDRWNRGHLVSDSALRRWYGRKVTTPQRQLEHST